MTNYTVIADRAIGAVEMHSDTDLTAARRWAEGYTRRDMGGAASIEVIWHAASGEVTFVWRDQVDLGLVDAIRPDAVIKIMVARKLQTADPATMLRAP